MVARVGGDRKYGKRIRARLRDTRRQHRIIGAEPGKLDLQLREQFGAHLMRPRPFRRRTLARHRAKGRVQSRIRGSIERAHLRRLIARQLHFTLEALDLLPLHFGKVRRMLGVVGIAAEMDGERHPQRGERHGVALARICRNRRAKPARHADGVLLHLRELGQIPRT
jgi:hypothetical protein